MVMTNMRYIIVCIVVFFCMANCSRDSEEKKALPFDFNMEASEEFRKSMASYNLWPMDEWEKCVLAKDINEYLNEMNNWNLVVVDSFQIRNYHSGNMGWNFSFVKNRQNKIYFIYLPVLYDYLFHEDKYYRVEGESLVLKDSMDIVITKINSSMLDVFLEEEVFVSGDYRTQHLHADRLLTYIFPELTRSEATNDNFFASLEGEPVANVKQIKSIVDPILNRKGNISGGAVDYRLYSLDYIGYILFDYGISNESSQSLSLTIYFIPNSQRYSMSRGDGASHRYKECYK